MITDASFKKIERNEEIPQKKFYRGVLNILNLPVNSFFQLVLLLSLICPYFCVLSDLTMSIGKENDTLNRKVLYPGTLEGPIFAFDGSIYFVDLVSALLMPIEKEPKRNKFLVLLETFTLIPFEKIYLILNGTSKTTYCWLRMRYAFRLIRCLHASNIMKMEYTQYRILRNYIGVISLLCITGTCVRLLDICRYEKEYDITCSTITSFEIEFTYFIMNSRLIKCGVLVEGVKMANLSLFLALFEICSYIYANVTLSKLICIYIEILMKQFDLAMTAEHLSAPIKKVRKKFSARWTAEDDHYLTKIKIRIKILWDRFLLGPETIIFSSQHADATFPDIFTTEMALDVSWNMFKHSSLFKNVDVHILRFLARRTKFIEYTAGDIIYTTDEFKTSMIYILCGSVQVLAQQNAEAAVISFTGGTCVGELSLFLSYPSNCIFICKTNCNMITLSRNHFVALKKIFPITYNNLKLAALDRLGKAKQYNTVCECLFKNGYIEQAKKHSSLGYIKRNLRKYLDKKIIVDMLSLDTVRQEHFESKTVFCADYLSLYVLSDQATKGVSDNILLTGIFFKLKPSSMLVHIWNMVIYIFIVLTSVIYPIGCALEFTNFLQIYQFFMNIVSILYLIDFMSFAWIAVEGDGLMLLGFQQLFNAKIKKIDFWIDFVSSFPICAVMKIFDHSPSHTTEQILHLNKFLKSYKLLNYIKNKHYCSTKMILLILTIKMFATFIVITYLCYYIMHLIGFFVDVPDDNLNKYFFSRFEIVIQYILTIVLYQVHMDRSYNVPPLIVVQYGIVIWKYVVESTLIAGFSLHLRKHKVFDNFVNDVHKISALYDFEPYDKRKVEKYLRLNYKIGFATVHSKIMQIFLGKSLYRQYYYIIQQYPLGTEKLFQELPIDILKHINELGEIVLVPSNEMVCYAGSKASYIYILVEGYCAYVQEHRILKDLELGTAFTVIEALSRLPIVHNIQALSDCKLIRIPVKLMVGKFLRFPTQYHILFNSLKDTIRYDYLKQLQHREFFIDRSNIHVPSPQFINFHKRFLEYVYGFGKYSKLRMFILKVSIKPYSKFWFYWEICRMISALCAAYLGSIPITTYSDYLNVWFWIFRIFDLTAFADIYLRHHVIYFNKKKIEVSHPWKTACNYWKTSFVVDLLGALPFDWIFMYIVDWDKNTMLYLILPRINKYLQLYRCIGFRKYLKEKYFTESRNIFLIYYGVIVILICNLCMPVIFFHDCTINYIGKKMKCGEDEENYWPRYLLEMKVLMKYLFNIGIFNKSFETKREYTTEICLIGIMGYVSLLYVTAKYTGLTLFKLSYLTTYQIKMQRLINFIDMCKIDKRLKQEIIKYFEYVWILNEGRNVVSTLKNFHNTLCDEILFTLHSSKLIESLLFHGTAPAFLKELSRSIHTELQHYLIRGIVIRVNDIQGHIYILVKGEIDVLDSSYQQIDELFVGSIFGCLDNISRHRSMLTYVAKTHCDFLCIPVQKFYRILLRHPSVYRHYKQLLKQSNVDFIKSKGTERKNSKEIKDYAFKERTYDTYRKKNGIFKRLFKVHKPHLKLTKAIAVFCFISVVFEYFTTIQSTTSTTGWACSYILDIIFVVKIYMDFSIAYEDAYGILIFDRKLIALRYAKKLSGLTLNILCVFPFEIFALFAYNSKHFMTIYNCLIFNRLLKIVVVFQYVISLRNRLNINVFVIRSIYILLVVFTVEYTTFIIWEVFDSLSEDKQSPWDKHLVPFAYQTYLLSKGIYDRGNDKHLSKDFDLFFIIVVFVTTFLALFIFSECVATYQVLKFNTLRFQSKLQLLEVNMVNKGISSPLRTRIIKYFGRLLSTGRNVQMPSFLILAPFYIRQGILDCMFGNHLRIHPVFKDCHSDLLRQLSASFETLFFFKGDFIAYEGDIDEQMYFIHQGVVVGLAEDNLYTEKENIKLTVGDYFGFQQIIYKNAGHACSYKVIEDSIILVLKRTITLSLLDFFPASKHIVFNYEAETK